jgi:hypothetical protein
MLLVHLVSKVNGVDFDQFKRYNITRDEGKRNRVLYEIIKMFEMSENSKAIIPILLTMIQVNPDKRHLLTKVVQDFNIQLFGAKDSLRKGETLRFFSMTKEVAPNKHGYLKATVVRPHLRIHDIDDLIAANIKPGEQIKEVELFFWNKHIRDKELILLSKGLNSIHSIESLKADFGNYPEITNYGLSYFLDTLKKFKLKKFSFSVGTSEVNSTKNINDKMIIGLLKLLKKMPSLEELALNLQKYFFLFVNQKKAAWISQTRPHSQ